MIHKSPSLWIFILVCLAVSSAGCRDERLRVHFINAGYGDCALIELPLSGPRIMIDAGGEAQAPRLIRYLKDRRIGGIDTVIITHPHKNHFGGLKDLTRRVSISRVYINADQNAEEGYTGLLSEFKRRKIPVDVLSRGEIIHDDPAGTRIEVLHPEDVSSSANGNAIVIRLVYRAKSFLFTSDIEPAQQEEILALYPDIKDADIISVPHHGGALSPKFIDAFLDKTFIVSTGPNVFGLPLEEQLKQLNGRVLRTDREGTILAETNGKEIKISHD